ncbi:MAG: dihydrolipoyl dehydrogenase [Hyphomicrobiales bacterium]|nr:dihydrolipoyl dehydrogenase [Hyphomicrobiales bacterium]
MSEQQGLTAADAHRVRARAKDGSSAELHTDVVVIGAGPGGYTAAFRAADLGKKVVLVERYSTLGGVCLNVGCIPSKALLHVARVAAEAEAVAPHGLEFGPPRVDLDKLRAWKQAIVTRLTKGLAGLARQRQVDVMHGLARFVSPHSLKVSSGDTERTISFDHCIIATGSRPATIPGLSTGDPRIVDSTGALELTDIPRRLLVVGGGIIGLEMATIYDALGSRITVVEAMSQLVPGADPDLVKPLHDRLTRRYDSILLGTKVARLEVLPEGLRATFDGANAGPPQIYDRVLVAIGRQPSGRTLNAEAAGIGVDARGCIPVDRQMRTNVPHILAIGDVTPGPMLAHKAAHEGKIAAEVIAGHNASFSARTIPSVAYTDPEIAWMGMTETAAKSQGIDFEKVVFPWVASGRALAIGREEGVTKLLIDRSTRRLLGAGIVGPGAGDLISEAVVAYELDAEAGDLALSIHPHPTLSETIAFAAEIAEGTITDLPPLRRRAQAAARG